MNQTSHTEPKSIVLRSTHILLVKVIAAHSGEWVPSKPGLKSRTVDLSLQITEVLRGRLDPAPKAPVKVKTTPSDYASELMMQPLPGVWSRIEVAPGTELVIFSHSGDPHVEHLLSEPSCLRVTPAEPILPGLRIAVRTEAEHLPLDRTLALAAPETARLDPTFAEFLWDRFGDATMTAQPDFDLLAAFAERKGLDASTRDALLTGAYNLIKLHHNVPPALSQRLALAMCRVLLMPEAADLHGNLIGTYLPNLLGVASRLPPQHASAVFKGHESERDALAAFLHQHHTGADAKPLRAWLDIK